MLNFIHGHDSMVVGIMSNNSRVTKYTVETAKKMGIPVFVANYVIDDLNMELFQGIRLNDKDNFKFDFAEDKPDDFIYLTRSVVKPLNKKAGFAGCSHNA